MKKFVSFILVVFMLLATTALISCSSDNGYGVSKKMDSEIRAALVGEIGRTWYETNSFDLAVKYKFEEGSAYREVYWERFGAEKWEEQCVTCSYYVTPTKIVISSTEDEFYYIFENGEITYLEDEPYSAQ